VAANGLVEGASREVAVFPEVSGTLATVVVMVNQEVEAGALLFELHNETQKAQVALAEAELTSAQARLQHAKADWDRSRDIRLTTPGAIAAQTHDADRYRWLTTQAQVEEAHARLRLARAELAKTQVKAPLAGRVLQVHCEPGTLMDQRRQADPVLRLADVSRRRVRAWVEELDVARVAVGQRATVTADGFPGREFPGQVAEIVGRMGRDAPRSDRPGEREDIYYREVVIELENGMELPLNLRVDVYVQERAGRQSP
jgi:RND family efflux transporter MFP subunit